MSARGAPRRRLRRRCSSPARSSSSGCRPTRTGARCATAPPASPTTTTHDHWECPEGEHLWPHEFDHERRLVRYRAKAHVCNALPAQGRVHRLRPRARDRPPARPVAALGGRALPPRHRADAGRRSALLDRRRRGRPPPPRAPRRRCWPPCWSPARSRRAGWRATCASTRPTSPAPVPSHGLRMVVTGADGRPTRGRDA